MKLPRKMHYRDVIKILDRQGFVVKKDSKKHLVFTKVGNPEDPEFRLVVVPRHRSLALGTLQNIIRSTGLTKEEFFARY